MSVILEYRFSFRFHNKLRRLRLHAKHALRQNMGFVSSNVEHRSFIMQIAKQLDADDIDEMKFLIEGQAINKMRLKSANVCELVRILGELEFWTCDTFVCLSGFAELCRKVPRHDLATRLEDYGKKKNFRVIFSKIIRAHNKKF